jgi:predicted GNAT family acetyltransferase
MAVRVLSEEDRPAVRRYLSGRLIECLFLASNLENYGLEDDGSHWSGTWLGYHEGHEIHAVAQLVNQGSLLVAISSAEAAAGLARAIRARQYEPLRILGMRPEVEDIHARLNAEGEFPVREIRDSVLQVLTPETFEPRPSAGMRLATMDDVPKLLEWKRRFRVEAMGDDPAWVDDEVLKKSLVLTIEGGRQYVFEAGGRLVSMARLNARTRRMAQLGGVYTPTEERGNGYATRLISGLCQRVLEEEELEAMTLMVEEEKEAASAIYRKLGFLGLGCYRFLLLEPKNPEDRAEK